MPEADLDTPCMTRWRPPELTITDEEEEEEEKEEEGDDPAGDGVDGSMRRPCNHILGVPIVGEELTLKRRGSQTGGSQKKKTLSESSSIARTRTRTGSHFQDRDAPGQ